MTLSIIEHYDIKHYETDHNDTPIYGNKLTDTQYNDLE
jgi:hypothetical protein